MLSAVNKEAAMRHVWASAAAVVVQEARCLYSRRSSAHYFEFVCFYKIIIQFMDDMDAVQLFRDQFNPQTEAVSITKSQH